GVMVKVQRVGSGSPAVVSAGLKQGSSSKRRGSASSSKAAMTEEVVRAHAFISGKVQGVFYRNNTVKQAQERGLFGWVRNLQDGRVELQTQGPKGAVEDLLRWCHQGPAKAVVREVQVTWVPAESGGPASFKKMKDALNAGYAARRHRDAGNEGPKLPMSWVLGAVYANAELANLNVLLNRSHLKRSLTWFRLGPGMIIESLGAAIVRGTEALDSDVVLRLAPSSRAEVLQLGLGSSGKRILIRSTGLSGGEEGWVSVIAQNAAPLWRVLAEAQMVGSPAEAPTEAGASKGAEEKASEVEERRREWPPEAEKTARQALPHLRLTDCYHVGDICVSTGTVLMRRDESLEVKSPLVCKVDAEIELEVLKIGTGPSGKRLLVREARHGKEGWVSVVREDGAELLRLQRREAKQSEYFVGEGHALGGSGKADPRAAALAAAEQRQASALSHGVGEAKVKQLREREQREALLKKVTEVYTRRKEEVPFAMQSISLDALQKHWEHLQRPVAVESASSQSARPSAASPSWHVPMDFEPPSRLPRALSEAAHAPAAESPEEWRRLQVKEASSVFGLSSGQLEAVSQLEALGFDYGRALEAFLACEHNQELAANYLLEGQIATEVVSAPHNNNNYNRQQLQQQQLGRPPPASASKLPPAFPGASPREQDISLLKLEWDAVRRIQELGFDRATALKAFLACGQDEELAGNRLLL
ncbi:unnamed protein product, partial [Polarella glacialis]